MKLYVGNLPFSVNNDSLKKIFEKYGEIEEATVISDKFSNRSKGFGFVTFKNDADAQKAIAEMNEKEVEGRNLKVSESRPREEGDRPPRRDFGGNRGFDNRRPGNSRGFRNDRR